MREGGGGGEARPGEVGSPPEGGATGGWRAGPVEPAFFPVAATTRSQRDTHVFKRLPAPGRELSEFEFTDVKRFFFF